MSAWGKTTSTSWADDVETDTEVKDPPLAMPPSAAKVDDDAAFPSLAQAASTKQSRKKKEKRTTVTLAEFTSGNYVGPGGRSKSIVDDTEKLSLQEKMMLPTGPRERSEAEIESSSLGGGFKGYGGFRGDRRDDRGRDREGGRGRDRERDDMDMMPSRADESANWGEGRKSVPSGPVRGGGFRDAGRYDDDRESAGPSRADEVDDWGATKKSAPPSSGSSWGGGRSGRGFDGPERGRSGFDDSRAGGPSKADEVDSWSSQKKPAPSAPLGPSRGFDSGPRDVDGDRWGRREPVGGRPPGGERDFDRWGRRDAPPPAADDRVAGERPRLVLQKRTVPLGDSAPETAADGGAPLAKSKADPFGGAKPRDQTLAEKDLAPHSEEKGDSPSVGAESEARKEAAPGGGGAPARAKLNPFGAAKPREVLLEERGQDWRKVDLELEQKALERPDSEEEKKLKQEIADLRAQLESARQRSAEEADSGAAAETEGSVTEAAVSTDAVAPPSPAKAVPPSPGVVSPVRPGGVSWAAVAKGPLTPEQLAQEIKEKEHALEALTQELNSRAKHPGGARGPGAPRGASLENPPPRAGAQGDGQALGARGGGRW